jgi:hypothetical protein
MTMIVGSIDDERRFLNLRFMKKNLNNKLTTHLDLVVKLFVQKFFTLDIFLFATTMNSWTIVKSCHGAKV